MFDAGHGFVLSYQRSLPFWRQAHTWHEPALGIWQFSGVVTLMSGTPFTRFGPNDVSLEGSASEVSGFSSNRPNVTGNANSGPAWGSGVVSYCGI